MQAGFVQQLGPEVVVECLGQPDPQSSALPPAYDEEWGTPAQVQALFPFREQVLPSDGVGGCGQPQALDFSGKSWKQGLVFFGILCWKSGTVGGGEFFLTPSPGF